MNFTIFLWLFEPVGASVKTALLVSPFVYVNVFSGGRGREWKKKTCHSIVHEIQLFWRGKASSATKNFIADPKQYSCSRKRGKNIFHRKPSLVDLLCLIKKANALGWLSRQTLWYPIELAAGTCLYSSGEGCYMSWPKYYGVKLWLD